MATIWKSSLRDSIYNLLTYSPSLHYKPFTFSSDQKPKNHQTKNQRTQADHATTVRDPSCATWAALLGLHELGRAAGLCEPGCVTWRVKVLVSWGELSLFIFFLSLIWWVLGGCWGWFGWINAQICGLYLGLWKFEKGEWEKNWVWVSRHLKIFVL